MSYTILFYIVLGAEGEDWHKLEFPTEDEAKAYAAEHGGDVYPVVDVKISAHADAELRVLDVEDDE